MHKVVKDKMDELGKICLRRHVLSLCLFGSGAKNNLKDESDLDFIVQFSQSLPLLDYADNFFELIIELETLFNRKVDLITFSSLKNPILIKEIENTKIELYAA